MDRRRPLRISVTLLAFLSCTTASASGQVHPPIENLTLKQTLGILTSTAIVGEGGLTVQDLGQVLPFLTSLEVATTPFGTSSGSFVFKLDPSTGIEVRAATTFGPSFADRALTSGEGKVSVGASFLYATYDRLNELSLKQMRLVYATDATPQVTNPVAASSTASLGLSSKTLVLSSLVGVTNNLDIGVAVPLVSVKVDGVSWICFGRDSTLGPDPGCQNAGNTVASQTTGGGQSMGVGDIAIITKYRFLSFGEELPDPGGLAALVTMRLPTGDVDNLRGLGINRTLVSLIASWGKGRLKPHGNAGFEVWSKGLEFVGDPFQNILVKVRHQVVYAAGVEFEAAPKLTLLFDFLGRHTLGGGRVDVQSFTDSTTRTNYEYAVALPKANTKLTLAPGLKLNLKGKLLVSLNALVPVMDKGLYDRFTPAVSVELNF